MQTHCEEWLAIFQEDTPVLDVLEKLFNTVISHNHNSKKPSSRLIAVNALEMNRLGAAIQTKLKKGYQIISNELEALFLRGQANNEFSQELDAKELGIYVLGALQGIMLMSRSFGRKADFTPFMNHTLAYLRSLHT